MSTQDVSYNGGTSVQSISAPTSKDIQEHVTEVPRQIVAVEARPRVGLVQNIEKSNDLQDSETLVNSDWWLGDPSSNSQAGVARVQQSDHVSKYQFKDTDSDDALEDDEIGEIYIEVTRSSIDQGRAYPDMKLAELSEGVKRLRALAGALDREVNTIYNPALPNRVEDFDGKISRRLKRIE